MLVEIAPGLEDKWTCPVIQEIEDRTFANFDKWVTDPRFINTCHLMPGFTTYIIAAHSWTDKWHRQVVGRTECPLAKVTIGDDDPKKSAYSHEMAHVIQRCLGQGPYEGVTMDGHENWERDGIYAAVWESEGLVCKDKHHCSEPE